LVIVELNGKWTSEEKLCDASQGNVWARLWSVKDILFYIS